MKIKITKIKSNSLSDNESVGMESCEPPEPPHEAVTAKIGWTEEALPS